MDSKENSDKSPDIDFSGLILGFSGAALMYLGDAKAAPGERVQVNLALARQNIEFISLLAEKTKGNLNGDEQRLLQEVLLDLRMRFIEKSKENK